jgi:hypothetical protein
MRAAGFDLAQGGEQGGGVQFNNRTMANLRE